jgi:AraC-like DNA-binding protein
MAVVSSCTFAEEDGWENVRARGESLGIDLKVLRKAYHALPRITEERAALLHTFIDALSAALELAEENIALRSAGLKSKEIPRVEDMLESFFKSTEWAGGSSVRMLQDKTEAPLLVRVVCELVLQRPDLPLTVRQLAGAARITPNHFTTLFHKSTGVPFTEFQSEVRITRAKKLLGDLTLNISDVARHVGFADAGYFARRFRQRTGLSPSEWRSRCSQDA